MPNDTSSSGDLSFARRVVSTIPDEKLADELLFWRNALDDRRWAFVRALREAMLDRGVRMAPPWR